MSEQKFTVILELIVPQIIELITVNDGQDAVKATKDFYKSELYSMLEDEETKLWQYSPQTLYTMYESEIITGRIRFPGEEY